MLTLLGRSSTLCDGLSRRTFLKVGGLGVAGAGLSLSDIYKAQASETGAPRKNHKAVINIFLGGGPPHLDMFDLKPEAPSEIRGEFRPINTDVPGMQICEVFPRLAQQMKHSVIIRSVVGANGDHYASQVHTGWHNRGPNSLEALGGRPSIGAASSKLLGPVDPAVPSFVGLAGKTGHGPWADVGMPGFLGPNYAAFKPDGPGLANMTLKNISLDRLEDRKALRASFDGLRKEIDSTGVLEGADQLSQRAFNVLTSNKLVDALDLSKEDPRIRDRYSDGKPYKYQYDGSPTCNDHLLIARRLIESGVRVVTLSFGRWDSHGDNFKLVRDHGGKLDVCLSALVEDLQQRGMLNDTCIAVWGEFGRTPRINKEAGRDHWPQVHSALLIGGGLKTGQVIGSTNRLGEYAKDRPTHMAEIVATLYHTLGIDTSSTTITDPTGRPQYLVDHRPMKELV